MLLAAACRSSPEPPGAQSEPSAPTVTSTDDPAPGPGETLLAAGDIAACGNSGDEATAALLDAHPGTVATLGDTVYEKGTSEEFASCYEPSWGRHLERTRPAPGNHDYGNGRAKGYFEFFGPRAGEPTEGWYSYDLGAWHVVALNSNCRLVGGCEAGSPQQEWLKADLAAHPARCTLAYWHHARFSSGLHGSNDVTAGLWQTLHEAGAELVLTGHDHDYERFAPLSPEGRPDPGGGIRQFVVGTGGRSLYPFSTPIAGSQIRSAAAFGVLELTLREAGYHWRFLPVEGSSFTDTGSGTCH